jgi:ribosomal-protein-alanine N-acetyltransferase
MVHLRDFKEEDAEHLIKHLNNENVVKYLTTKIPYPYTAEDASWWISTGSKEGITRAIEVEGDFSGVIGVAVGEYQYSRSAEIGYWLGEEFWGKGTASNAVAQMTSEVFSSTEIIRLFAPVFSPNKASMRVLEKCSYKFEGVLEKGIFKKGEFFNEHMFARLNS